MKRLGVTISMSLWLVACQSAPSSPKLEVHSPVTQPEAVGAKNDQVGEHLIDTAALVSREEVCTQTPEAPWVDFEQQRLDPAVIAAGQKFNHQLVYVVCDPDPGHIIEGTLYRNIYRKGRLLHRGPKPVYLKPGRWRINALIGVPAKSKPGAYTLKTEFIGKTLGKNKLRLIKQIDFEVQH